MDLFTTSVLLSVVLWGGVAIYAIFAHFFDWIKALHNWRVLLPMSIIAGVTTITSGIVFFSSFNSTIAITLVSMFLWWMNGGLMFASYSVARELRDKELAPKIKNDEQIIDEAGIETEQFEEEPSLQEQAE